MGDRLIVTEVDFEGKSMVAFMLLNVCVVLLLVCSGTEGRARTYPGA